MKKVLILIIIVVISNLVFAQNNKNGYSISLKGGLTYANMYGEDVESKTFLNGASPESFYANQPASNKFKNGINYGLSFDYRLGKYFSFGIGVSYIQKGASINATRYWNSNLLIFEDVSGEITWIQDFWTLDIPITIYFPLKQNDVFLKGGFFRGYLINVKEQGEVEISEQEYSYINDRGANEKELGYFLACGYMHTLPKEFGKVFIEVEWSRSIINSIGSDITPGPQYYYNQTISLNIGYRYNIRVKKE